MTKVVKYYWAIKFIQHFQVGLFIIVNDIIEYSEWGKSTFHCLKNSPTLVPNIKNDSSPTNGPL